MTSAGQNKFFVLILVSWWQRFAAEASDIITNQWHTAAQARKQHSSVQGRTVGTSTPLGEQEVPPHQTMHSSPILYGLNKTEYDPLKLPFKTLEKKEVHKNVNKILDKKRYCHCYHQETHVAFMVNQTQHFKANYCQHQLVYNSSDMIQNADREAMSSLSQPGLQSKAISRQSGLQTVQERRAPVGHHTLNLSHLVICSWIASVFASAKRYSIVQLKQCVWLFGYRSWFAIAFKKRYRPGSQGNQIQDLPLRARMRDMSQLEHSV